MRGEGGGGAETVFESNQAKTRQKVVDVYKNGCVSCIVFYLGSCDWLLRSLRASEQR